MRRLIICIYVLYLLILTYFSLTPEEHAISQITWDKASHFIAYFILFVIAKNVHVKSKYITCAIICYIYSFVVECIQYIIPGRHFDGLDLISNTLGIVLGVIVYYYFIEKYFVTKRIVG